MGHDDSPSVKYLQYWYFFNYSFYALPLLENETF